VAIHDISYQTHPEWFGLRQQLLLRLFTRLSVCRATRIVCCSNFTRSELLAHYGKEADAKISTVYYAPDNQFRREVSQSSTVVKSYNITRPYFLFVGSLLKRRNILRLLEAFQATVQIYPQYRLVLIGNSDEMGDEFQSSMVRLGIAEKVFHLNYVEEEHLTAFYREAFCFVHPSTYEGFALPVVEALACGTPTIIANAGAMVEVADGAAHVVDSLESLAEAMIALVENPSRREEMIRRGLERAQKLSWAKTASAFMSAIESACEKSNTGEP
jgi:glycosyltransferase involved in cell wall biosynthesis